MSEPGITINPASKITAAQWVTMIKQSQYIPQYVKQGLKARNNVIVGPTKIKQPDNMIPRDWPDDLAAVFASKYWEITTAAETFVLTKTAKGLRVGRRIFPDLQKGEFGPGFWLTTGANQREWSPDMYSFDNSYELGHIALEFGETFSSAAINKLAKADERTAETRLQSKRALIIIVNRVTVHGVKPSRFFSSLFQPLSQFVGTSRQFSVSAEKLLSTFFHELAAHAGRMNQGKTSTHGNTTVESTVQEIEALFPEDTMLGQVVSALGEAESRLKELQSNFSPGAQLRTPGPLGGASARGRPPGPGR